MRKAGFRAWMSAGIALPMTVLLGMGPQQAVADEATGDWGFPLAAGKAFSPGTKMSWHPELTCNPLPSVLPIPDTAPCKYSKNLKFVIKTLSDGSFMHENWNDNSKETVDSHLPLRIKSTMAQVGQCIVESADTVRCQPDAAGTLASGDSLIIGDPANSDPLQFWTATTSCEETMTLYWYQIDSEPQRGGNGHNDYAGWNDFYDVVTSGRCESISD
ncbi:hypothetical protein [Streptomyces virginiae]|uniref:hypothetical protein n=1 Tax=Streptomyces virginiae TaxID=1961 RepID=UPI00332A1A0D